MEEGCCVSKLPESERESHYCFGREPWVCLSFDDIEHCGLSSSSWQNRETLVDVASFECFAANAAYERPTWQKEGLVEQHHLPVWSVTEMVDWNVGSSFPNAPSLVTVEAFETLTTLEQPFAFP